MCISVAAVTAAYGSALTAGHFRKARKPAQSKVTKALLPHHLVPRLGSACLNEGIAPWALRGGPTEQCRSEGMPSLGEAPSGGAEALLVTFGALPKSDPL
nr:hypothetical protein GCM10020185_13830 [Pseudomonas brassicacearum subsp. brassicacearum]